MTNIMARLRRGDFLLGTWAKIPAMETVQMIGHAGFDFVVLDMEHAPLTVETAYRGIVQAQACGMSALVRVPDRTGGTVQRLLDAGADGILVPRVESVEIAATALSACAFPPMGTRGMGYTARAGRWGFDSVGDYLEHGRTQIMRCAQLEDRGALMAIDDILAAPALNAVFIGFADLALGSGLSADHSDIRALESKVLESARDESIPVGTAVQNAAEAQRCRDAGYSFVMVSADTTLLVRALQALSADLAGLR